MICNFKHHCRHSSETMIYFNLKIKQCILFLNLPIAVMRTSQILNHLASIHDDYEVDYGFKGNQRRNVTFTSRVRTEACAFFKLRQHFSIFAVVI